MAAKATGMKPEQKARKKAGASIDTLLQQAG
jgi:hypothetical protein